MTTPDPHWHSYITGEPHERCTKQHEWCKQHGYYDGAACPNCAPPDPAPTTGWVPMSDAAWSEIEARYATDGWQGEFKRKAGDKARVQVAVDMGIVLDEARNARTALVAAQAEARQLVQDVQNVGVDLVAALDERDAAQAENARLIAELQELREALAPLVEYAPLGRDDDCRYCYRIDPAREGHARDCEWDIARRALAGEPAE